MTYPFVGRVQVPTPTGNANPTTKLYVDNGLSGKADSGHTHTHPLVPNAPFALAFATSLTPAATNGNYQVCTATNSLTLNVPTSGTDRQMLRLRFIASGGTRVVTFHANIRRPATIASTLSIASGKRGDVGLLYEAADGWTLLAAQVQA